MKTHKLDFFVFKKETAFGKNVNIKSIYSNTFYGSEIDVKDKTNELWGLYGGEYLKDARITKIGEQGFILISNYNISGNDVNLCAMKKVIR